MDRHNESTRKFLQDLAGQVRAACTTYNRTTPVNLTDRTRKNESAILNALATVTQVEVASALETSESTISRMKSDKEIHRIAVFLAACQLKVVPEAFRCAKPEVINAAMVFAKAALELDHNELFYD